MRLFVSDETMTDERAKITLGKMAAISDFVAPVKKYIEYTGEGEVTVAAGCVVAVGGNSIFETEETVLSVANLDDGAAFEHGKDYYIYICDPGTDDQNETFLISQNSTFPNGDQWDDLNTRKIGGFHYGRVRNVDEYGRECNAGGQYRGSGWESNVKVDIVPNSVWTMQHRPQCEPSGMVYLGNELWGDIYLASDDGANGLQSLYGATPITGTEGLNWYIANERARRVGKRLPTYAEFCIGAEGSPQGLDNSNANGHTATSNTARALVGLIPNAVSVRNVCDEVGNVWKWLDEFIHDPTGTTGAWFDVFPGYGKAYMYSATGLHALIAGGHWGDGVNAGARTVNCNNCPWYVGTPIGAWCVCDAL